MYTDLIIEMFGIIYIIFYYLSNIRWAVIKSVEEVFIFSESVVFKG